ncbi:unnamed protein product [Phaedon cochleariae]|uniref:Lipase n=1 Tax=Phaedon cochleariae TaxID=80249 RepID=A0A9P0DUK6_PHACE|nr:unnamed protein product [Phaedon cochleariae]
MTRLECLILLSTCSQLVTSWIFKDYPYADLSFIEKIRHDGYPLEMYELTTEDNYILTTVRIPHGVQSKNKTGRSPVLLLHGMGGTPEMFVMLGKGRALAYNLADSGFDVWFLSSRGTELSQRHKYYDIDKDLDYWNFDFHEIAIYDIPTNIDFIMKKTGQKVFTIGHSQGNTCYFITTSERPEYNEKIKIGVSYAPSLRLHHMDIPFANLFVHLVEVLEAIYRLLDLREIIPFSKIGLDISKRLCREQTYFLEFCNKVIYVIGSHESKIMDKDMAPVLTSSNIGRASARQLFHYMQITKTGQFKQYDHGWRNNLKIYGNETPPAYDLKKSTAPVALYYGPKDDLVSPKGAIATMKSLPNVVLFEKVDYEHFNHLDFLFGWNASELVYQKTIQLFKDFDNGILPSYNPQAEKCQEKD